MLRPGRKGIRSLKSRSQAGSLGKVPVNGPSLIFPPYAIVPHSRLVPEYLGPSTTPTSKTSNPSSSPLANSTAPRNYVFIRRYTSGMMGRQAVVQ